MIPDCNNSNIVKADAIPNGFMDSTACHNSKPICGVVEGFYGRPWTAEQRRKLFNRMSKMKMNTYIYAPKDDAKHRAYWRDLYTVEEAEMLTTLIEAAEQRGITFVYAISPGLDMIYSDAKEMTKLKRKLKQVASFGCKAFALLFDDIEKDMCDGDRRCFQSFAAAHVSVTNEIYYHLRKPETFFFCPTEYCASRAVPSVLKSEYLNTVGSKLHHGIDVMWTGPRVISRNISVQSIIEVSKVLRRPPLIWDNIHANDYDQKRIFMGPYDGRAAELLPYLRGVVTNPNCEFESNYVALHTLAQWCRLYEQVKKRVNINDIKLEMEDAYMQDGSDCLINSAYFPRNALMQAIEDWHSEILAEIASQTESAEPITLNSTELQNGVEKLIVNELLNTALQTGEVTAVSDIKASIPLLDNDAFSLNDLKLLVELFYLPFEHGQWGCDTLAELHWLKVNAVSARLIQDWTERCGKLLDRLQLALNMFERLYNLANKSLIADMFTYIWDMKAMFILLVSFVQWLQTAYDKVKCVKQWETLVGPSLWLGQFDCRKGTESDGEPWPFRAGLLGEFQLMLPFRHCADLLLFPCPTNLPGVTMFNIRPYTASCKEALCQLYLQTNCLTSGGHESCSIIEESLKLNKSKSLDTNWLEAYLHYSPEMCFILEDVQGICGYILAASDANEFLDTLKLETNCESMETSESIKESSACEFNVHRDFIPSSQSGLQPSIVHMNLIPERIIDLSAPVRLLATAVATLKVTGSTGVYTTVNSCDHANIDLFRRLGFVQLPCQSGSCKQIHMARII
jgi:protein O-GlcNAcase/histone acetyltransferase